MEDCNSKCGQINSFWASGDKTQADYEAYVAENWIRPSKCLLPAMNPDQRFVCLADMTKWTFNGEKCVQFSYGGCGGTENLYDTETECNEECNPAAMGRPRTLEACSLPRDRGHCFARLPVYGFNQETNRCEKFFYGGNDFLCIYYSHI